MINVMLSGCNGKMGKVLSGLLANDSEAKVVCGFDINTDAGEGYPVYDNVDAIKEKVDVVIDFSHPNSLSSVMSFCKKNNVPVVVATTGLSDEQKADVVKLSENVPVFFSFNMSLGINLLVALSKKAAAVLDGNFDIEIVEKHHNQKLDAPSGTAIMLAEAINETLDNKMMYEYDRHSKREKRPENQIGIHSVRGGNIVGEHEVIFAGHDEFITLSHQATSKEVFAVGALKAALFMSGKSAGLYDMNNIITL